MDLIEIGLILVAGLIMLPVGFIIGRWMDMVWQAKQKRKFTKQNLVIVNFISKDNKTITPRLVNMSGDVLEYGNKMWIIKAGRIYRKDKPEMGLFLSRENLKWEEGVPTINLSEDTIKPLDYFIEDSNVKPEELGATLSAWVYNQLAKGFASLKNQSLFIMITMALVAVCLFVSFISMSNSGDAKKMLNEMVNSTCYGGGQTIIPPGGSVQNGTIVIKAPGVT